MDWIGYTRVSTDEQARSGLGLEAQRASIETAAALRRARVVAWYTDDGVSGDRLRREGLHAALLDAAERSAPVVAAKGDRFIRSTFQHAALHHWCDAAGVALIPLDRPEMDTTTASGRLMSQTLANVAEYELNLIRERTSAAMQAKIARGEAVGPGAVPVELAERIRTMRGEGMTLQAIADALNGEGVPTARGGLWRTSTVHQVAGGGRAKPKPTNPFDQLPPIPNRRRRKARAA